MALASTIFKADLGIADMERNHYASHSLTIALHPSETLERMMVRILAFGLHAEEGLSFGRGLSSDEEPAVQKRNLTGDIELWIDVGLPDARAVRKACNRSDKVRIYAYGRAARIWWTQQDFSRHENLSVILLPDTAELEKIASRSMNLDLSVQEGNIWIGNGRQSIHLEPVRLKS